VAVNGSDVTTFNMAAGDYTLSEIASYMQSSLNGSPELQSAGSSVSVTADNGELSIISSRYGTSSKVDISNISGLTELNLVAESVTGQNVDGKLYTDSGSISIGAYVDGTDGRRVNVSNFAPQEELRGLQFEVLGGAFDDGAGGPADRGTITFVQGFASRLEEAITNIFEADNGLVTQRIESLNSKNEDYDAKQEKLDARYETLLLKYQLQFSALQSILSSAEQTRSYLSQTFSNSSDS
jgi:flagellar hook-associated protein 2